MSPPGSQRAAVATTIDRSGVREARPAKPTYDARQPIGQRWEVERGVLASQRRSLTVFLAGAECPFTCLFCDLWQYTLPSQTPAGALPHQLAGALAAAAPIEANDAIKLYNASNFFDRRAVPPGDLPEIADLCSPFTRVTVESHPKLLGNACADFADRLSGRLEIAMGLETVHPTVFPRLKDGMTIEDFDTATTWAKERGIGVRTFVLVGLPWIAEESFAGWAARSALHAIEAGADRVSLIPLRAGSGTLTELRKRGELAPIRLRHLEDALEKALGLVDGAGLVEADLWDVPALATCDRCADRRVARLATMNREQRIVDSVECSCSTDRGSSDGPAPE